MRLKIGALVTIMAFAMLGRPYNVNAAENAKARVSGSWNFSDE